MFGSASIMSAMYTRTYENSYDDIANGAPLKRQPTEPKASVYDSLPASYRKVILSETCFFHPQCAKLTSIIGCEDWSLICVTVNDMTQLCTVPP